MDHNRVNAAVRIKLSIDLESPKRNLRGDLRRLLDGMTSEEWNEYQKRVV